jgi:pimeloyl-CoA dehydrogenase
MDFDYSLEQQMLRDSADRFGAENWPVERRLQCLKDVGRNVAKSWEEMAGLGWLMLSISEQDGGLGGSAVDVMALMEGIGRHLIPVPYVASCVLAPALLSGGGDLAAEVLQAIGEGKARVAAGFLEPEGGFDLAHVGLRADRGEGGWRLSGEKLHVEDGGDAEWYIVSARNAGGTMDAVGISLFMIPCDAPGMTVQRFRAIDGHIHARLRLDGVTRAMLIGESDNALDRIEAAVDRAIVAHAVEAVGSMEMANTVTLDYLKTRRQFGVSIGSFQVLQHRAVDMMIAAEEARSMMYHAALRLDAESHERRRAVSAAKTRVGQTGLYVARQAVQLHGGVGTSDELIVSHHFKRQMMLDAAYGTADYHRSRYANAA